MKKLLLAVGILLLAGCTEKDPTETPNDNAKEVNQQEEQSVLSQVEKKTNQQLSDVLEGVAVSYGVMRNNPSYYNDEWGLVHADLMDLNKDGRDELYLLFKSSAYFNETLTHRNQDGYIFEIWAANDQKDEAELVFNEVINLDSYTASDLSISFVKSTNGETYVKKNHFQIAEGTNMDQSFYYAFKDDGFDLVLDAYHSYGTSDSQLLDGTEVDLATFEEKVKPYEGEESFIVKSSVGEKELAFDTSDISGHIGEVFTVLTKDSNPFLTQGEAVSGEVFDQITAAINDFPNYRTMDKRDIETYERIINGLILEGIVEFDGGTFGTFTGITESQVAKKMKELFDIDLDVTKLDLPIPEGSDYTKMLHYKDGMFYIPQSDYYSDSTIRNVTEAKKITDDLYLVLFRDTYFNSIDYVNVTNDFEFDPNTYAEKPITEWPENTQEFISTGIPSYAVVKVTDGNVKLYYMGYVNLTEEELRSF